ncbi:MAG: hypothetical protein AVDCRST_MAG47-2624 [uncultured Nocardioidaceae bacterium]|uniref:Uncharacterized protein n=1 Tax=uncultured Nocardioidaceae bacterium TaxID=253824 RepID=A0A6J4NHC6_9ACTN|nr:MAG: hypothetical protein AVDCRST_MAG47-2624 [uncultured Nocardioidaceae bacterium]
MTVPVSERRRTSVDSDKVPLVPCRTTGSPGGAQRPWGTCL